jgi:hypothetical protein
MCNTYRLSTATIVARQRLYVSLYVHWLCFPVCVIPVSGNIIQHTLHLHSYRTCAWALLCLRYMSKYNAE